MEPINTCCWSKCIFTFDACTFRSSFITSVVLTILGVIGMAGIPLGLGGTICLYMGLGLFVLTVAARLCKMRYEDDLDRYRARAFFSGYTREESLEPTSCVVSSWYSFKVSDICTRLRQFFYILGSKHYSSDNYQEQELLSRSNSDQEDGLEATDGPKKPIKTIYKNSRPLVERTPSYWELEGHRMRNQMGLRGSIYDTDS